MRYALISFMVHSISMMNLIDCQFVLPAKLTFIDRSCPEFPTESLQLEAVQILTDGIAGMHH
jgi:hypothetical protein